jgi:hypothetical protein
MFYTKEIAPRRFDSTSASRSHMPQMKKMARQQLEVYGQSQIERSCGMFPNYKNFLRGFQTMT